MAKFLVSVDAEATWTYTIEAETQEEAYDKVEKMLDEEDFMEQYRKDCELMDARVWRDN